MVLRRTQKSSETLTEDEQIILKLFDQTPSLLRVNLSAKSGLKPSETDEVIANLKEKGYVEVESKVSGEIGLYDRVKITKTGSTVKRILSNVPSMLQKSLAREKYEQNEARLRKLYELRSRLNDLEKDEDLNDEILDLLTEEVTEKKIGTLTQLAGLFFSSLSGNNNIRTESKNRLKRVSQQLFYPYIL